MARSLTNDVRAESPLTPYQLKETQAANFHTIATIYRTSPLLIPLVGLVLLLGMQTQYSSFVPIAWLLTLTIGYFGMAVFQETYFRTSQDIDDTDFWIVNYARLYWVINFVWAGLVPVFWMETDPTQNMMLLMILIAHVATVQGISFRIPSIFYATGGPPALMILIATGMGGTTAQTSIGITSALYCVFLFFSTRSAYRQNLDTFAIRFKNEHLVEDLASAKKASDLAGERLARANLDLQEREELFRALVENTFDGIFRTDEKGYVRYTAPSIRHFGLSPHNTVGKCIAKLFPVLSGDNQIEKIVDQPRRAGQVHAFETQVMRPDGKIAWLETSVTDLGDSATTNGLIFNMRDITARKQADEEMQAHLEILDALATGAPLETILRQVTESIDETSIGARAAIFLTDDQKCVIKTVSKSVPSRLLEAIEGTTLGPTLGCSGAALNTGLRAIVSDTKTNPLAETFRAALATESMAACWAQPIFSRNNHIHGTLTIFFDEARAPTEDEIAFASGAAHLAGIAIDRRKSEKQLREASQTAEMANRAKSRFLATMSHELRTPLNAIIGFSEVMHQQMFGPLGSDRYHDYMGDILNSGRHLLSMIDDILDLSKIEAGRYDLELKDVSIEEVIGWSTELVRPKLSEGGLTLILDLAPDLPLIHADRRSLRQILLNLLSNAIKFTPPRGGITVSVTNDLNAGLTISVIDTGIGIPADRVKETLEPFVQVESSMTGKHHGTGLGLSITKTLVEMHDGVVNIESEEGVGTRVSLTFPSSRLIGQSDVTPIKLGHSVA